MNLNEHCKTLVFQPLETVPWTDGVFLPAGIVLKRRDKNGEDYFELLGNEVCGRHTAGCDCCSSEWSDALTSSWSRYDGWAWIIPGLGTEGQ